MHTLSVSPQRIGPVGGKPSSLSTLCRKWINPLWGGNGGGRCIPNNEKGGDFPFQSEKKDEYKGKGRRLGRLGNREGADNGFQRRNLHAQWGNSACWELEFNWL